MNGRDGDYVVSRFEEKVRNETIRSGGLMKIRTLEALILFTVAILVISEVARWVGTLFGVTIGLIGGIIVIIVYGYCARQARASMKYYGWILVPTILFTVVPTVSRIHDLFKGEEGSFIVHLFRLAQSLFSFVLPVGLLLIVYFRISKIENSHTSL
jgi:hypothetical protein